MSFQTENYVVVLALISVPHKACTCARCSSKEVATSVRCRACLGHPLRHPRCETGPWHLRRTARLRGSLSSLDTSSARYGVEVSGRTPSLSKGRVFPFRLGVDLGFNRILFRFDWNGKGREARTGVRQTNFGFDPRTVARGRGAHVPLGEARRVRKETKACVQERTRTQSGKRIDRTRRKTGAGEEDGRLQSTWLLSERRRPNVPFQTSKIRRNDKEWSQSTPFERFVGESVHCDHPPVL